MGHSKSHNCTSSSTSPQSQPKSPVIPIILTSVYDSKERLCWPQVLVVVVVVVVAPLLAAGGSNLPLWNIFLFIKASCWLQSVWCAGGGGGQRAEEQAGEAEQHPEQHRHPPGGAATSLFSPPVHSETN